MRRREIDHALGIVLRVESLLQGGRPRMRPGKDRPLATTEGGTPVNPRSRDARKFSLEGALIRACWLESKEGPKATVSRAKRLILDKLVVEPHMIDHVIYDTREIERELARIERDLRKDR